mmetsp:Transcript_2305/g.4947  ORF Transcript_2305/g.4947 Transcript_2305/m.4947 type:complete len:261 (-) Transcript_2305:1435-2217(-)
MIEQTNAASITQLLLDRATLFNDPSRNGNRKFPFTESDNDNESSMITSAVKRRKLDILLIDEDVTSLNNKTSILQGVLFADESVSSSDHDDIFEWMDNIFNGTTSEVSVEIPDVSSSMTKYKERADSKSNSLSEDMVTDSFLTMNESDPCYEEMISLLAEDEKCDDDSDIFKKIKESFVFDRLLRNISVPMEQPSRSTKNSSNADTSKIPSSLSSCRTRSSRIGIRERLEHLMNASRQSAKTRDILMSFTISSCMNKNQQ